MNPLLQQDADNLPAILTQTLQIAGRYLAGQQTTSPGVSPVTLPPQSLPESGAGAAHVMASFESAYAPQLANSSGPRYFGFVTGGATPASLAADWLVSVYDQVVGDVRDSVAARIELQTIELLKQLFGLTPDYSGTFVTGATMASFVGLSLARQWAGHRRGVDVGTKGVSVLESVKVLSGTPHSSIDKVLSMLGLGRESLVRIDTLPGREAISVEALENYFQSHSGETFIVVGNAGTVNTADFDDLEKIGQLKEKYPFWLHVDAAFGGFAACSPLYAYYVQGLNYADSITMDAHKWLNVPYDAAMQFTRHPQLQAEVFHNQSTYLGSADAGFNFIHYTPENSRRFRALPAWVSLLAYGREGYRDIVERNSQLAQQFGQQIEQSGKFRLLASVKMNVVCFTINGSTTTGQVGEFLAALREDGRVFMTPTVYKGIPAIRAAISNWQTEERDVMIALEALNRVYDRMIQPAITQ